MARSSDSIFPIALLRDKTFQAREIRRVIMLCSLYLGVTTVLLAVFYQNMITRLIDGVAPLFFVSEDVALANEAVPALSHVLGNWVLAMLVVNVIVTFAVAIFITRRLGRPLLAIKRALREVAAGNLDVQLRQSDDQEFGELSAELQAAVAAVRHQIALARQGIEQASELNATDKVQSDELRQAVARCQGALDYFQLDDRAAQPKAA